MHDFRRSGADLVLGQVSVLRILSNTARGPQMLSGLISHNEHKLCPPLSQLHFRDSSITPLTIAIPRWGQLAAVHQGPDADISHVTLVCTFA